MGRSGHSSSRSRSRSTSASKSRSRSRSRSQSRSRRRSRSRSRSPRRSTNLVSQRRRSRSRSLSPLPGHRVHVADLGIDCTKREIQEGFERFGPIIEVWMARNPPCFAFVVYERKEDAETAVKQMNGAVVCNYRVRVSHARPRAFGRVRKGSFNPSLRCYQCGERGHFSRDCSDLDSRRRISSSRSRPDRYASHRAGNSRRSLDDRHRERRYSSGSPRKTAEKRSRSRSRSPTENGRRPSSTSQKKFRVGL